MLLLSAQPALIHDQKPSDHFRGIGTEIIVDQRQNEIDPRGQVSIAGALSRPSQSAINGAIHGASRREICAVLEGLMPKIVIAALRDF